MTAEYKNFKNVSIITYHDVSFVCIGILRPMENVRSFRAQSVNLMALINVLVVHYYLTKSKDMVMLLKKWTHHQIMLKCVTTHDSRASDLVGSTNREKREVSEADAIYIDSSAVSVRNFCTYSLTCGLCYAMYARRHILLANICNALYDKRLKHHCSMTFYWIFRPFSTKKKKKNPIV